MPTIDEVLSNDPTTDSPAVRAIRERVMRDLATEQDFADAIKKTLRSVQKYRDEGMPTKFIGRTPYIPITEALEWLERYSARGREPPRGPGRPPKA